MDRGNSCSGSGSSGEIAGAATVGVDSSDAAAPDGSCHPLARCG